jgi:hypothetical protein
MRIGEVVGRDSNDRDQQRHDDHGCEEHRRRWKMRAVGGTARLDRSEQCSFSAQRSDCVFLG